MKVSDEQIVAAMLATTTNEAAADALGISRGQLEARIKKESFKPLLAEAKRAILERAAATASGKITDALSVMCEVMNNEENSPQVRLNAADMLVRNAVRIGEQVEIAERLESLEARLWAHR